MFLDMIFHTEIFRMKYLYTFLLTWYISDSSSFFLRSFLLFRNTSFVVPFLFQTFDYLNRSPFSDDKIIDRNILKWYIYWIFFFFSLMHFLFHLIFTSFFSDIFVFHWNGLVAKVDFSNNYIRISIRSYF